MQIFAGKTADSLTCDDLKRLVADRVAEARTIEYKLQLPGAGASDKREYLADVASFANAAGGWLFYGIRAEEGIPVQVTGLDGVSPDKEILRLEGMLRSGLDPSLQGVQTAPVLVGEGRYVIVQRVPRSWASPHMIAFQDSSRFYCRASAGKYVMGAPEVRNAFLAGESFAGSVRAFRAERLAVIASGQTPAALRPSAVCVLHIVPRMAFASGAQADLAKLWSIASEIGPLFGRPGEDLRYNFDGVLSAYYSARTKAVGGYAQFFRNGCVESVGSRLLGREGPDEQIPDKVLVQLVVSSTTRYLAALKLAGVEPPVVVMLSFLGVRGSTLASLFRHHDDDALRFDRDDLIIPEVLCDSWATSAEGVMQPMFDTLWNALGEAACPYFDTSGCCTLDVS